MSMSQQDKVLVTGAAGFTGNALACALLREGHAVRGMCRRDDQAEALRAQGIEPVIGDIVDADAVDRAVDGVEKVYHIAACFRTSGHGDDYYEKVNVDGTRYVLEAAERHGCERVVHCSTGGVHGHIDPAIAPADESAPIRPGDIYQVTKLRGEELAVEAMKRGQRVSVFRPAGIYGPGDLRLLKLFGGVQRGRFPIFGPGRVCFGMVYIDDLIDGIIRCGTQDAALGEVFILSGVRDVPVRELVERVAEAVGGKAPKFHLPLMPLLAVAWMCEMICVPLGIEPPLHRRRAHFFTNNRQFTCAKATRLLGYRPSVSPEEGILRTAAWYMKQGLIETRGEAQALIGSVSASTDTPYADPGASVAAA